MEERGQLNVTPQVVIGLGNPGPEYEWTRHNVGAHVVREFAERYHLRFRSEKSVEAMTARGCVNARSVILATPLTYMNESGRSVAKVLRCVGVGVRDLMVVVDDIETPLGQIKIAFAGGTRGHNGLRSIQGLLGTMEFTQMRIGVGRPGRGSVAEYVLRRFEAEEMTELPSILERSLVMIEEWLCRELIRGE